MLLRTLLYSQVFSQSWLLNILLTGGTDGALASETPATSADLKIILSGKFLEASQVLDGMLCPVWIAFHTTPAVHSACHNQSDCVLICTACASFPCNFASVVCLQVRPKSQSQQSAHAAIVWTKHMLCFVHASYRQPHCHHLTA